MFVTSQCPNEMKKETCTVDCGSADSVVSLLKFKKKKVNQSNG